MAEVLARPGFKKGSNKKRKVLKAEVLKNHHCSKFLFPGAQLARDLDREKPIDKAGTIRLKEQQVALTEGRRRKFQKDIKGGVGRKQFIVWFATADR